MDSTDELLLLNQICDDFEEVRRAGNRISIDQFLEQHERFDSNRSDVNGIVSELIGLEISFCDGDPESVNNLKERYPQYTSLIENEILNPTRPDLNATTGAIAEPVDDALPKVEGFKIQRLLGRGGMGSVYLATQISLGRQVAIKMINASFLASATRANVSHQRFEHEAMAASRLKHDNIVMVHEVNLNESAPWFTMEFVDGPSLAEKINQQPMNPKMAATFVAQCADAIDHAHKKKIIHRDIKPQNILISATGDRAFVTDFGLAKLVGENVFETIDGQLLGTPAYMSPEQAESSKNIGPASDIYSLGATLYHALTGRPPFQSATHLETMRQIRDFDLIAPRLLNRHIPVDLESVCLKALSFMPEDRYASAAAMCRDLNNFIGDRPTQARPSSTIEKVSKWRTRNPALATSIFGGALLGLALLVTATIAAFVFRQQGVQMAELAANEKDAREEAVASLEGAYKTFEPYFMSVDSNRGIYQDVPGTHALREELLTQFIQIAEEFGQHNPSYEKRFNLMSAYSRLGFLRLDAGTYRTAIEAFDDCEDMVEACRSEYETFSDEIKNSMRRLYGYHGEALRGKAQAHAALGESESAETQFRIAVEIADADSDIAMQNGSFGDSGALLRLTNTSREFGRFLLGQNRAADARDVFVRALAKRRGFYELFDSGNGQEFERGRIHVYKDLATIFALAADAFIATGQRKLAEEHIDEMWQHLNVVTGEQANSHNNSTGVEFLVCQCWNHAVSWAIKGFSLPEGTSAKKLLDDSLLTLRKLVDRNPEVVKYRHELEALMLLEIQMIILNPKR